MKELLFPPRPRDFPGRRAVKVTLRATHVLCAGVLVGAYLFGEDQGVRVAWLVATVCTGLLLLALDLHQTAAFLLETRGVVVLVKVAALAALPAFGAYRAHALAGILLLSVVSSHAPASIRHRILVRIRGVDPAPTKG